MQLEKRQKLKNSCEIKELKTPAKCHLPVNKISYYVTRKSFVTHPYDSMSPMMWHSELHSVDQNILTGADFGLPQVCT